jgi:hypothetical protein
LLSLERSPCWDMTSYFLPDINASSTTLPNKLFWVLSYSVSSFILLFPVWKLYVTEIPTIILNQVVYCFLNFALRYRYPVPRDPLTNTREWPTAGTKQTFLLNKLYYSLFINLCINWDNVWSFLCSEIWRNAVWNIITGVSKKHTAPNFSVEDRTFFRNFDNDPSYCMTSHPLIEKPTSESKMLLWMLSSFYSHVALIFSCLK